MDTTESKPAGLPPELLAEMAEAARIAMSRVRDPEVMRQAAERMDRIGEEMYHTHGLHDIGVPVIYEMRAPPTS